MFEVNVKKCDGIMEKEDQHRVFFLDESQKHVSTEL